MPRIIILLLILGIVFYLAYKFRRLDKLKQKRILNILIVILVSGLLVFLVLSGRLNWLIAAVGALLPLIPRGIRFFSGLWPYFQRYRQNRQSSMLTRFIHLKIDMLTGHLQGEVLEGSFAGQKLQGLTLEQLVQLLDQCKKDDAESAALLVAFLKREHPEWVGDGQKYEPFESSSEMSEQQARDILGVSEAASEKEIIKAHKRLMQKLHPDRGGSGYLAQQINRARDVLLTSA